MSNKILDFIKKGDEGEISYNRYDSLFITTIAYKYTAEKLLELKNTSTRKPEKAKGYKAGRHLLELDNNRPLLDGLLSMADFFSHVNADVDINPDKVWVTADAKKGKGGRIDGYPTVVFYVCIHDLTFIITNCIFGRTMDNNAVLNTQTDCGPKLNSGDVDKVSAKLLDNFYAYAVAVNGGWRQVKGKCEVVQSYRTYCATSVRVGLV